MSTRLVGSGRIGDAHAGFDAHGDPVEFERVLEGLENALGDPGCGQDLHLGQEHGELVPAEAGDSVGRTYHPGEPGGDLDEQHISRVVTEGVVDLLEPVEIKHHDRRLRTAAAGRRQRLRGSIRKQQSVRQPGQRVMQALMPHGAKVASDHQIQPDEQQQGGYWARHQRPDLPMLRPRRTADVHPHPNG